MNEFALYEVVKIVCIFGAVHSFPVVLSWAERKVSADIQDRIGPNRVGPLGLLQPLADGIKLFFKEDIIPRDVDRVPYILGPFLAYVPVVAMFAVIPFGRPFDLEGGYTMTLQVADLHIGILFALSIVGLDVYGLTFGGWGSANKFSLLGGIRSTSQMIAYEVAMGLALVALVITTGSLRMSEIVATQAGTIDLGWLTLPAWNVFLQPVACLIFCVAMFAETHRLPFDLPEAEQELVGGYHTEYSSMKFALFFMGEYVAIAAFSGLAVTLFFGGYELPFARPEHAPSPTFLVATLLLGLAAGANWRFARERWAASPARAAIERRDPVAGPILTVVQTFLAAIAAFGLFGESLMRFEGSSVVLSVILVAAAGLLPSRLVSALSFFGLIAVPVLLFVPAVPLSVLVFLGKTAAILYLFMWVRWTLPRFRYDMLLALGWRGLVPLGMLNVLGTALFAYIAWR